MDDQQQQSADETTGASGSGSTRAPGSLGFQIEILKCWALIAEEQAKHNRHMREHTAKAHEEWRAAVARADAERAEDRQRREEMIAAELARADKIIELLSALTASANDRCDPRRATDGRPQ